MKMKRKRALFSQVTTAKKHLLFSKFCIFYEIKVVHLILFILLSNVCSICGTIVQFEHEACTLEVYNKFAFTNFHEVNPYVNEEGIFEQLIRFRGVADGHIALTTNSNDSEPLYLIILGSYNNRVSEIRRTKRANSQVKINTLGILSNEQWKGFLIRYNMKVGDIWVYPEGSDNLLLYWKDPEPLMIKYFSFATYHGRILQVAFNCTAKDKYSIVQNIKGKMNF